MTPLRSLPKGRRARQSLSLPERVNRHESGVLFTDPIWAPVSSVKSGQSAGWRLN